jgi:hypothetical protein
MRFTTITPMTVWFCVAALRLAAAQVDTTPDTRSELAVFGGVTQGARSDATVSPSTFTGFGYGARVEWSGALAKGWCATGALGGSALALYTGKNEGTALLPAPAERVYSGGLTGTVLDRLVGSRSTAAVLAGLSARGAWSTTEHRYADPTGRVADFVLANAAGGPTVVSERSIADGLARLEVSLPLLNLVDHPYSETRAGDRGPHFRLASPRTFRGFDGALRYASAPGRHVALVYAYRLSWLSYADVQPVSAVTQSLSVGVVIGGAHRGDP